MEIAGEGPDQARLVQLAESQAPGRVTFHGRLDKAGVDRLRATNVQTPEDRGLVTLGETNTLILVVVVR